MFTFRTMVKHKDSLGRLQLVADIDTRALTAEQAERQALAKEIVVRDAFGRIVDSPELLVKTVRKFTVEVQR